MSEATRLLDHPTPDAWVRAAELFRASGRRFELAWCRYREAEARLASSGSRAEATAALGEAGAICAEIGAAPLGDAVAATARAARLDLPARATDSEAVREPDAAAAGVGARVGRERHRVEPVGDGERS